MTKGDIEADVATPAVARNLKLSVTGITSMETTTHTDTSLQNRTSCIQRVKNPYQGNREALGWAFDGISRMVIFSSAAVFLSTALINLAKRSVGCETEIPEGSNKVPECNEKVYGLKPSSILTTYGTVLGLIVSVSLPFVGAALDHTRYRKTVGQLSALIQILLVFSLCFINAANFFIIMIAQVVSAVFGWIHTLVIFAYLPGLTSDSDLLVKWTANFHLLQYVTLVLYLPVMVGVLNLLGYGDNDVVSARIANGSAFGISAILLSITWTKLMKPREALQTLPPGVSIWTIGFKKVGYTGKALFNKYRSLMWFFINVSLVEAAQSSLSVISLTYMTDVLQLTVTQNSIAIFTLFVFASIGTFIGQMSIKKINPIRSNQICQIFTILTTAGAAWVLRMPGQQWEAYSFAGLWGVGAGWKTVVERFAVTQMIPKEQDAEMMGFYLFASQVLIWCPTLIFTSLNEAGFDPRIGIAMLNVFFLGGLLCLSMMENYDKIREARELASSEIDSSNDPKEIRDESVEESDTSNI